LFAGSDNGGRHWAIIATLIHTAKLNDVDPLAWLTDVLERIVSGRTKQLQLDTLPPWNWKAEKEVGAAATGQTLSRKHNRPIEPQSFSVLHHDVSGP